MALIASRYNFWE